jgi:hypothetical protein
VSTSGARRETTSSASGVGTGGVGTSIAVRIDARVGSVGGTVVVVAVGASRLLVLLVRGDSVLDLVNEVRHDEGGID